MRRWMLCPLVLILTGCASTPSVSLPTVAPTLAPAPIQPTLTPSAASTEAQTTPTSQASPTSETAATGVNPATPVPSTVPTGSTAAAAATPLSTNGWKTYTNTNWHVAIDYPPDWSTRENAAGVTFIAPRGAAIQLAPLAAGGLSPGGLMTNEDLPNTRCRSQTNRHGITARLCFDTLAFSTNAEFIMRASNGPEQLLSLSMARRTGDAQVFDAMLASIRPLP